MDERNENLDERECDWEQIFNSAASDRTIHVVRLGRDSHSMLRDKIVNIFAFHRSSYSFYLDQLNTNVCVAIFYSFQNITSVYKCFNRFVDVESVQSRCDDCVYVQFSCNQVAATFLRKGRIENDGIEFRIRRVEKFHDIKVSCDHNKLYEKDPKIMLQPPAEDSPDNILNALPDFCLAEIFRKLNEVSDFISVANVCVRFNTIAKEIFSSKIRCRKFQLHEVALHGEFTMSRLESYLQYFGSSVRSMVLRFDDWYFENTANAPNIALEVINKYCKHIVSLTIFATNRDNQIKWMNIRSILPKLKILIIQLLRYPNFESFSEFVSACSELETFEVYGDVPIDLLLPRKTLPKLISFTMYSFKNRSLEQFLTQNVQLKKVELYLEFHICTVISHNLANIEELTLYQNRNNHSESNFLEFIDFNHVKLNIFTQSDGGNIDNVSRQKSIVSLTIFIYKTFNESHLMSLAKNLPKLEELKILLEKSAKPEWFTADAIKRMLQHTQRLSELTINCFGNPIHLDANDYKDILQIVENRAKDIKLKIIIDGSVKWFTSAKKRKLDVMNIQPAQLTVIKNYTIFSDKDRCRSFLLHLGLIFCMILKIAFLGLIFF